MSSHQDKVDRIARQVRAAAKRAVPIELAKDSVPHFVPNPFRDEEAIPKIDLRGLDELLVIDPESRTCTAESGLTFSNLVRATLPHGLMPCCVSELEGITIGGAVSGCSIESMSYRLGGFHDNCLEYEIVTGTGEILTCSPEQDPSLFHLLHGSYGTLGIITKLTFKLLPAKPFVHMEYRKHSSLDAFWQDLRERCERADYDFVDGIIHSPSELVLCLGRLVAEAPWTSSYTWLDIFYQSTQRRQEDYLTLYDYFFRYDTECHWLTRTIPPLEWKPVRFLVGKIVLGSTNLIKWSGRLRHIMKLKRRPDVVVDVFIPARNFPAFYDWYVRDFDFFPLWVVPYRMPEIYPWISDEHQERTGETFVIDCAVYGKPNNHPTIDYSELLERKVFELAGSKTLISRNHYDEETFWRIYARDRINAAKQRLDPNNLFGGLYERFAPHVYEPKG